MSDISDFMLWRIEETSVKVAKDLIEPLTNGLEKLKAKPEFYKNFDAKNGWGTYDDFVPWVEKLLIACLENPEATISTNR
ncbi:hypothetical protein LCGC14_0342640 [marine sediment metagenome]|uniref:Uncharacterized protein n=1 Tax=marine sediment metagenome TaxID=412755 RepID=A0A0F9W0Q9_9ZZZZ